MRESRRGVWPFFQQQCLHTHSHSHTYFIYIRLHKKLSHGFGNCLTVALRSIADCPLLICECAQCFGASNPIDRRPIDSRGPLATAKYNGMRWLLFRLSRSSRVYGFWHMIFLFHFCWVYNFSIVLLILTIFRLYVANLWLNQQYIRMRQLAVIEGIKGSSVIQDLKNR